jgi:hypothetical protein
MAPFIYRCPTTGQSVQGWFAGEASNSEGETYLPMTCLACAWVHFVNPATRKVLGAKKDE